MKKIDYTAINAKTIDEWVLKGWQWGRPLSHEDFLKAKNGSWDIVLTPSKTMPHEWLEPYMKNGRLLKVKVLGLASGGGQQMPIMAALGADCTVFDISTKQLESERLVAAREGYPINIVQGDMTKPFPFEDASFDIIIHPVSNCYVEKVEPVFLEAARVLRKGGLLIGGYDNGLAYLFSETSGPKIVHKLPFNPLKDPKLYDELMATNSGVQFSHTMEEQIGGQCRAGFVITDLYEDYDYQPSDFRWMADYGIPTFIGVRSMKV
jgi:SAM-dependent methyltransferase